MAKKPPSDHEARKREALAGLLKEPEWTVAERLKDLGFNILALIASIILIVLPILGIGRGFGFW